MRGSRGWWVAVGLGVAGMFGNMVEVQLGWGLHLLFGNAIALLGLRLLGGAPTALAVAIASTWTVVLWLHPWAWIVWSLEGLALAMLWRRAPPLMIDLLFWIMLGAPLLLATYGGVMGMDGTSLGLVVAKQAVNGLANVLIAELLYLAILNSPLRRLVSPQPVPALTATLTAVVTFTLVPALLFLALDSRERDRDVMHLASQSLDETARTADAALSSWIEGRSLALGAIGREILNSGRNGSALPDLGPLGSEFDTIVVFDADGQVRGHHGDRAASIAMSPERVRRILQAGPTLSDVHRSEDNREPYLDLTLSAGSGSGGVYATLGLGAFETALGTKERADSAFVLIDRRTVVAGAAGSGPAVSRVQRAIETGGAAALANGPHLLTSFGFGTSLMTSFRDVVVAQAAPLRSVPGWTIVTAVAPTSMILAARTVQFRLFVAISAFVTVAIFLGAWIARRVGDTLSQMAEAAVGLADREALAGGPGAVEELVQIRSGVRLAGAAIRGERETAELYRRQLSEILRHAPVILYALSMREGQRGRLETLSGSIERILGFTDQEVRSPGWWRSAIHPDDSASVRESFERLEHQPSVSHEYRLRGRDGRYRWMFNTLVAMPGRDGRLEQATGVLIDITDRKEAQLQLLQAAKLASLGEMATGLAHELNQPLSIIKLAATNLSNKLQAGHVAAEDLRQRLDRIIGQIDRASSVITRMRIFGRKTGEPPGPVRLGDAIEGATRLVQQQLAVAGIRLELQIADDLPPVEGHLVLLEQVLINLLLNARDAIVAAQSGEPDRAGRIAITARRFGNGLRMTVQDNGGGIPDASLPRVFEPFYTTKAVNKGTGLGLSISYGIVRDMGGTIAAANAEGGASFTIDLPAARHPGSVERAGS